MTWFFRNFWPVSGVVLCIAALLIAYFYFQLYYGLPPCPLCILDRYVVGGMAVIFLLLALIPNFFFKLLGGIIILGGFITGGRHIYLERFASQDAASSCLPQEGAQNLIDLITQSFAGTSDCSVVYWQISGLTIADLTFILFVVLAFVLYMCPRARRRRQYDDEYE